MFALIFLGILASASALVGPIVEYPVGFSPIHGSGSHEYVAGSVHYTLPHHQYSHLFGGLSHGSYGGYGHHRNVEYPTGDYVQGIPSQNTHPYYSFVKGSFYDNTPVHGYGVGHGQGVGYGYRHGSHGYSAGSVYGTGAGYRSGSGYESGYGVSSYHTVPYYGVKDVENVYGVGHHEGYGVGHREGYGVGHHEGYGVGHHEGYGVGHGVGYGVDHGVGYGVSHGIGYRVGHDVGYGVGHNVGYGFSHGADYGVGHGVGYGIGVGHGAGYTGLKYDPVYQYIGAKGYPKTILEEYYYSK